MDISRFDAIHGRHFSFELFENELVLVQSAGFNIAIGVKNARGKILYQHLIKYPFASHSENLDIPSSEECEVEVVSCSSDEIKITFITDDDSNILTITCANSGMREKPIKIQWE